MSSQIRTWQDIPGFFDFQDVYDQAIAEAKNGDILIEVGTFLGKSAAYMADRIKASGKELNFYCVDSWDEKDYDQWWIGVKDDPPNPWPCEELHGKTLHEAFWYCMEKVGNELQTVIRKPSVEAARMFVGDSVRFVFIDANHSHSAVLSDIQAWWYKIRPGGILAGHDYGVSLWPGVKKAVDHTFGPKVEHRNNSWLVRKDA